MNPSPIIPNPKHAPSSLTFALPVIPNPGARGRAKREQFDEFSGIVPESQGQNLALSVPESQGQNLALNVLFVPKGEDHSFALLQGKFTH